MVAIATADCCALVAMDIVLLDVVVNSCLIGDEASHRVHSSLESETSMYNSLSF